MLQVIILNSDCEKTNYIKEELDPVLLDAFRTEGPANFQGTR